MKLKRKKQHINKLLGDHLTERGKNEAKSTRYIDAFEQNPVEMAIKKQKALIERTSYSDIDFLFNTLNPAGLDSKGQHNMALAKMQKGASVNVKVDVGSLFCPGFVTLSAEASTEFKTGKSLLVNLEAQRSPMLSDLYICLSIMQGACRNFKVKLEAEASAGIDKIKNVANELNKIRTVNDLEAVGFSLDLKAEAKAGVSYEGEYLYAFEPVFPRWFLRNQEGSFTSQIKATLNTYVFGHDIEKSIIKQQVCEFLNSLDVKVNYKKKSITRLWGKGHISTQKLITKLEKIREKADIPNYYKEEAQKFIELLTRWGGKIKKKDSQITIKPNKYCSLRLHGHKGAGNAGISIAAGITREDKSKRKKSEGSSETKSGIFAGAKIDGSFKRTSFRYQMLHIDNIVKTQDTIITYKQAGAQMSAQAAISIEVGGEQNIGKGAINKSKDKEIGKSKEKVWVFTNQMSYKCGILYWKLDDVIFYSKNENIESKNENIETKKAIIERLKRKGAVKVLPTHIPSLGNINVLPGSGLIYGQSVSLISMLRLFKYVKDSTYEQISKSKKRKYIKLLMHNLGMTDNEINYNIFKDFIIKTNLWVNSLIENFIIELAINDGKRIDTLTDEDIKNYKVKAKNIGILIEAAYTTNTSEVPIRKKTQNSSHPEPKDLIKCLRKGKLQSLRLRYRMRDIHSEDKNLFQLGFSVGIVKGGITLKEAKEIGNEGIVDISTYYITSQRLDNSNNEYRYNAATTVPPAVLFYQ